MSAPKGSAGNPVKIRVEHSANRFTIELDEPDLPVQPHTVVNWVAEFIGMGPDCIITFGQRTPAVNWRHLFETTTSGSSSRVSIELTGAEWGQQYPYYVLTEYGGVHGRLTCERRH